MMHKLSIFLQQQRYVIESKETPLSDLRVVKDEHVLFFNKETEYIYSIGAEEVAAILDPTHEDRAAIYYGEEDQELSAEQDFEVEVLSSLTSIVEQKELYLYISLDGKLRLMWNQKPSSKAYYLSNKPLKIETDGAAVKIAIEIHSKFLPLTDVPIFISNRNNKRKLTISSTILTSHYLGNNLYRTVVEGTFDPAQAVPELSGETNFTKYDTHIYDISFQLCVEPLPLTDYHYRVDFDDTLQLETATAFNKDYTLFLKWYATKKYHHLSFRVTYLKNETYQAYEKLKKEQPITDNKAAQPSDKKMILIGEYPHKAQDNGFAFFKYLLEEHRDEVEPYYVIAEDAEDVKNLAPYMEHVLFYKSMAHLERFFEADYLAHTHASNYLMPLNAKLAEEQKRQMKKVFLQHGVNSVRNIAYLYGKQENPDFTNLFLVSSKREYEIAQNELGYPEEEIKLTGLSRFDTLLAGNSRQASDAKRKKVLIMPSWRIKQDRLTDEEFKKTTFYHCMTDLITDSDFKQLCQAEELSVDLYLHTNFQKYRHLFQSDFVHIIPEGSISVQQLLRSHGVLITDFSSVGLDFALLKRPVLYYQFDGDPEEAREEGSTLKLPGPVFKDKEPLLHVLAKKVQDNTLDEPYASSLRENIYLYDDQHANDRIYQALKEL